jgi:hypothetical protein
MQGFTPGHEKKHNSRLNSRLTYLQGMFYSTSIYIFLRKRPKNGTPALIPGSAPILIIFDALT